MRDAPLITIFLVGMTCARAAESVRFPPPRRPTPDLDEMAWNGKRFKRCIDDISLACIFPQGGFRAARSSDRLRASFPDVFGGAARSREDRRDRRFFRHLKAACGQGRQPTRAAGFHSQRARGGGGIELVRDAGTISVGDVVRAFEGQTHLLECVSIDNVCAIQSWCKLRTVLGEAERIQMEYLDGVSLADVLPRAGAMTGATPKLVPLNTGRKPNR